MVRHNLGPQSAPWANSVDSRLKALSSKPPVEGPSRVRPPLAGGASVLRQRVTFTITEDAGASFSIPLEPPEGAKALSIVASAITDVEILSSPAPGFPLVWLILLESAASTAVVAGLPFPDAGEPSWFSLSATTPLLGQTPLLRGRLDDTSGSGGLEEGTAMVEADFLCVVFWSDFGGERWVQ